MVKINILLALSFLLLIGVASAIPTSTSINFKLLNSSGSPVNQTLNVVYKIYDQPIGGNVIYNSGSVSTNFDSGGVTNVILPNFTILPNSSSLFFLGTTIGSNSEGFPRINLTNNPYSQYSNDSNNLNGLTASQIINQLNSNPYLCNKTYNYINKYGKYDYSNINDLITEIQTEKGYTESWTNLRDYIDRWQFLCSDKLNRTLEEPFVCNKLYYFLLNKPHYSFNDLENLRIETNPTIELSHNLFDYYAKNYNSLCPKKIKPLEKPLNIFNITLPSFPDCSISFNNSLFDASIPIPLILSKDNSYYKGNMTCKQIDSWCYVVRIEQKEDYFVFTGIKLWWVLSSILILIIIFYRKIKDFVTIYVYTKIKQIGRFIKIYPQYKIDESLKRIRKNGVNNE